jgi:hypothetical protein
MPVNHYTTVCHPCPPTPGIAAQQPKKYEYLKHSSPQLKEIDDVGDYKELLEAFSTLGIEDKTLEEVRDEPSVTYSYSLRIRCFITL